MTVSRRSFIRSAGLIFAAPAIVRAASIMPVRAEKELLVQIIGTTAISGPSDMSEFLLTQMQMNKLKLAFSADTQIPVTMLFPENDGKPVADAFPWIFGDGNQPA